MKKVLLSVGVIILFVAYTIMQRHEATPKLHLANPLSANSGTPSSNTTTASPSTASSSPSPSTTQTSAYKDGSYTGSVANAFYGNVQVAVTINGGKIASVNFLNYPHDNPNSLAINQQAVPLLKQEALQAQSAHVDIVSGATLTSQAFQQSLANALNQAQA